MWAPSPLTFILAQPPRSFIFILAHITCNINREERLQAAMMTVLLFQCQIFILRITLLYPKAQLFTLKP